MAYKYAEKTVTLPVSQREAVIREGDGYAERILYGDLDKLAARLPDYWAHLTERIGDARPIKREHILELLVPDQEFLAVEIHRLNYGDELELRTSCSCGATDYGTIDLGKLPLIPLPEAATPPDPEWTITLPRTGDQVVFGFTTTAQEIEETETPGVDPNRFDFRAVRRLGSNDDPSYEDVLHLPLADKRALRRAIASKRCGYDVVVESTCAKCGRGTSLNLLQDPGFLLPGLPG
jgi:hypothetical protein